MTRIVLDTNVIMSAFLWGGTPAAILDRISEDEIIPVTSIPLINELQRILLYSKAVKRLANIGVCDVDVIEQYKSLTELVVPVVFESTIIKRDPADDCVLGTAISGRAEFIVSGNKHLTDLHMFRTIRIVTPAQFIQHLQSR